MQKKGDVGGWGVIVGLVIGLVALLTILFYLTKNYNQGNSILDFIRGLF